MSDPMRSLLQDPDMQSAPRALLRVARRARELARQTKTALVVIRDGVVVEEAVDEPESESAPDASRR